MLPLRFVNKTMSSPTLEASFEVRLESATVVVSSKSMSVPQSNGSISEPIILPFDLKPLEFPYIIRVSGRAVDAGTILLSPIELVVDQPINLGCFAASSLPESTYDTSLTPESCLISCNAQQMRFAGFGLWKLCRNFISILALSSGTKCSCLHELDPNSLTLLPESNCHETCVGAVFSSCGGEKYFSVYVAGREIITIFPLVCLKFNRLSWGTKKVWITLL